MLLLASAFLAGVFDSTVGGGGFVLIPALAFTGFSMQLAIGTSRVVFLMDSFSALLGHALRRNVDYRTALLYCIPAVAGAPLGAYLTSTSTSLSVSRLFGLFMLAMTILVVWRPRFGLAGGRMLGVLPSAAAGFLLGFLIGLLGGGVGVLIILALVFVSGLTVLLASGTSQLIVWVTNIVVLAAYYSSGFVDVKAGFMLGVAASAGAQAGVAFAHRIGNERLRLILMALTVLSAVKMLFL